MVGAAIMLHLFAKLLPEPVLNLSVVLGPPTKQKIEISPLKKVSQNQEITPEFQPLQRREVGLD